MSLPVPVKSLLRYMRRLLVVTDEWLSVLTGGELNTTISYRAARARDQGARFGCVLCRVLDVFQRGHCDLAINRRDLKD